MMLRILSKRTEVKVSDFRKGKVPVNKYTKVIREIEKLYKVNLFASDQRGMKLAELRADLTRLKSQFDIQWMVLDYLELLGDKFPHAKKWERSEELMRELIIMVTDLDIKALVVQKLNKDGWKSNAELSKFSGGGDLAYDVVNALILTEWVRPLEGYGEADSNQRTVISVKEQRLVEQTKQACNLWKDPELPIFTGK